MTKQKIGNTPGTRNYSKEYAWLKSLRTINVRKYSVCQSHNNVLKTQLNFFLADKVILRIDVFSKNVQGR